MQCRFYYATYCYWLLGIGLGIPTVEKSDKRWYIPLDNHSKLCIEARSGPPSADPGSPLFKDCARVRVRARATSQLICQ
jgi:hypothetical protein